MDRIGTVLVTDELPAYRWIGRKFPAHLHVNHTKGEYVRRDPAQIALRFRCLAAATAHVNTAESFNATLKRAWVGVFPRKSLRDFAGFSIKHTDRYLHETTFRSEIGKADLRGNARLKDTDARLADLFARNTGRLRWKDLTA